MKAVKNWILFFMAILFLSGLTAMPVESELKWLSVHFPFDGSIKNKLYELYQAVVKTKEQFPNLFYGYDWLAFAHFVLAILFIGPYRNPVKNVWVIDFGIICCFLVIPFAFVMSQVRQIPWWWTLTDCAFGIAGLIPLLIVKVRIKNILQFRGSHRVSQFEPEYSIL